MPVQVLPGDASVRAIGDFNEQFLESLLATFLIGPALFAGGVAYSLYRLNKI